MFKTKESFLGYVGHDEKIIIYESDFKIILLIRNSKARSGTQPPGATDFCSSKTVTQIKTLKKQLRIQNWGDESKLLRGGRVGGIHTPHLTEICSNDFTTLFLLLFRHE